MLVTPEGPIDCAWGDDDLRSLYVTGRTSLYRFRTKVAGLPVIRAQ